MADLEITPCVHGNWELGEHMVSVRQVDGTYLTYSDRCPGPLAVEKPTLFEAAQTARDAGMERVNKATDQEWKDYADEFIRSYALAHRIVFVDDLWDAGLKPPKSPRALGPRMRAAAQQGWITKTNRVRPSVRSHLTGKPIWVSNIYRA